MGLGRWSPKLHHVGSDIWQTVVLFFLPFPQDLKQRHWHPFHLLGLDNEASLYQLYLSLPSSFLPILPNTVGNKSQGWCHALPAPSKLSVAPSRAVVGRREGGKDMAFAVLPRAQMVIRNKNIPIWEGEMLCYEYNNYESIRRSN